MNRAGETYGTTTTDPAFVLLQLWERGEWEKELFEKIIAGNILICQKT